VSKNPASTQQCRPQFWLRQNSS